MVNINAEEILTEIDEPDRMRVTLYVSRSLYKSVQDLTGKNVSKATEALWRRLLESAGKSKPKK